MSASASSVPLVTSSVEDSGYDFDADLAANIDAQEALEALDDGVGGGQTEDGVYRDIAEFEADHDNDSDLDLHAASLVQPPSAFDHGSGHVDFQAMNGYDDLEDATAAFARQCAADASGIGYDQPLPMGSAVGSLVQQPADMNDASKRARALTDSQSATSEPRAAKRSPSRGLVPPPDASSSSGTPHPVREVGQYAAGLPLVVPRFVPSAVAAPVSLLAPLPVSDTSRDLLSELQELRSEQNQVAPTLTSMGATIELYQNELPSTTNGTQRCFRNFVLLMRPMRF